MFFVQSNSVFAQQQNTQSPVDVQLDGFIDDPEAINSPFAPLR